MDRPLDSTIVRRRTRKRVVQITAIAAVLIGGFLLLSAWITPSVSRNNIRTAVVERGPVQATISASGVVVPGYEQTLSSPAETRVLAILRKPGEHLAKGQSILELDGSEVKLALEQASKDLSLKANQRTQLSLDMGRTLGDLDGQLKIKDLRLEYLKSRTVQQQKMFELGGISKDQFDQVKLEERIATIERQELDSSIHNTKQSLENQLGGLLTEIRTLERARADIERQIDMLACKATRDGILTYVNQTVGSVIHKGDVMARIADLSSYRVDATTSDIHAQQLAAGLPVRVKVNDSFLDGAITSIDPTIDNGILKFDVGLEGRTDTLLRPNLRVDVFVLVSTRNEALRVAKGPFINNDGAVNVFVIREGKAVRVPVRIGVTSFDFVEVLEGLSAGDEVIISDMREYIHLKEIKINS